MNTPGRLGIIEAFEAAWQRRATPEEADRLHRVQTVLGVKDNDAILILMVALEHYQGLYSAMPARIEEAVNKVATDSARKQQWKALAIGIGAAAITILVTGWLAFSQGKEAGFGAGFKAARHEAAAASWANTPQGQVAYRLALVGSLEQVARCTAPGWKVKNGACLPYPDSDGSLHGWMMP